MLLVHVMMLVLVLLMGRVYEVWLWVWLGVQMGWRHVLMLMRHVRWGVHAWRRQMLRMGEGTGWPWRVGASWITVHISAMLCYAVLCCVVK